MARRAMKHLLLAVMSTTSLFYIPTTTINPSTRSLQLRSTQIGKPKTRGKSQICSTSKFLPTTASWNSNKLTNYITGMAAEHLINGQPPSGAGFSSKASRVPAGPELVQHVADAISARVVPNAALLKSYQSLVGGLLYCATHTFTTRHRVRHWHAVPRHGFSH